MSPLSVTAAAQAASLLLQADAGGSSGLVLGQLIQAKVLHHMEGSRYLVRLGGHERVVESALPLRADEVISLRVAGTRERIELERVGREASSPAGSGVQAAEDLLAGLGGGPGAAIIEELFRRYRGTLEPEQSERLRRAVSRSQHPDRMALAGLVLSKAGLPIHAELLAPLYDAIGAPSGALAPLHEVLEDEPGSPRWWPVAQWVLNAQGGGSIEHRVGMIPVEFGERTIEVEVALFEEHDDSARGTQTAFTRHRKLVLAFETERLGRMELRAAMADRHIRVALATESSTSTNALLRHGEALSNALAQGGWLVDEISHETRSAPSGNGVIGAALEHVITPGSVSRLV